MLGRKNGRLFECVVVDLNTQQDFCDPGGAQPVENARDLIPALRRVVAWVRRNYAPIVSSIESHRSSELSDSGYPICCLDGSNGQRKIPFTLLPSRASVEIDNTLSIPVNVFRRYQQVIFRKRTDDLLANPKADRLLTQLPVRELIVFGTGLETSIKALVLALLARDKTVTVVVDACGYWHKPTAELAVRQMEAKGANLVTVEGLLHRKLRRDLRDWYQPARRTGAAEGARLTGAMARVPRRARKRHEIDEPTAPPKRRLKRTRLPRATDESRVVGDNGQS